MISLVWGPSTVDAGPPLVLENQHVALHFAADTGTWIGVIDKQTGENLVVSSPQLATVSPAPPPTWTMSESPRRSPPVRHWIWQGTGLYAPATQETGLPASFSQGRFHGRCRGNRRPFRVDAVQAMIAYTTGPAISGIVGSSRHRH